MELIRIEPRMLKRAVIKEELVGLTGSTEEAVILNQFIYWSERMKDVDRYVSEEKKRMKSNNEITDLSFSNGWIYKKAEELAEEVMLGLSANTIRKYLNNIVDKGYLSRRNNPKYKWDKTFQYRVNLVKVISKLQKLGYSLEGYPLLSRNIEIDTSNKQNNDPNVQSDVSKHSNCAAIPEITTEITTENISETSSSKKRDDEDDYQNKISKVYLSLSKRRQLSHNDYKAINDVVKQRWDIHQVTGLIKDCFQQFKLRHERDSIRSFQYVANYIFDEMSKQNTKENIKDGKDSEITSADRYFEKYRSRKDSR